MKLYKVDPDAIKVPELRVTARFDEETYAQFRESMKAIGAIAPIICCQVDGDYVLVDGLHRLMEARTNHQVIDVAVIEGGDMVDVLTRNIFLDHLRGKTPVSEMVKVIKALWQEYGLDSEQIAGRTGLTRDYVEKLQIISELTPYCLASLDEGKIGVGQAFALTKLKDPVQQETVLGYVLLYHWTVKETEACVKDVLATQDQRETQQGPPPPPPPVMIKCFYCQEQYDASSGIITNPPTCRECASVMISSMAQARRELEQAAKDKASAGGVVAP
jgi:ParB-like chromosome segregation protein Spo0J